MPSAGPPPSISEHVTSLLQWHGDIKDVVTLLGLKTGEIQQLLVGSRLKKYYSNNRSAVRNWLLVILKVVAEIHDQCLVQWQLMRN
jgi:hypothetical protein